jgi:hypothetical protein
MSDPQTFLEKLEAKRRAVHQAEKAAETAAKKAETLRSELRGWEQAAQLVAGGVDTGPSNQDAPARPKRGLSGAWKAVIAQMSERYPAEVSLDDIVTFATAQGLVIEKDTVRSQMHGYVERGYVDRTSPGMYRVPAEGSKAADVVLGTGEPVTETAGADEAPAET